MSPTLEMSTSRIGRGGGGPLMLTLVLNTDREQDGLRASVTRRRPDSHTEFIDTDADRAAAFPGQQRFSEVEIPIPHTDPYRVAAVLKVSSVYAIRALRALLDEAEAALVERYPEQDEPAAEPATPADAPAELDPWADLSAPPAPLAPIEPPPIEPTPEQVEEARARVRAATTAVNPVDLAEGTAAFLGEAMQRIAAAHSGCWRAERCGICRELGPALALIQVITSAPYSTPFRTVTMGGGTQ